MGKDAVVRRESAADANLDAGTTARVVESIVLRGDISALGPRERAQYYVEMCERLGLNPATQPFAILRLNGKEILYPTRGATDQLAAIHRVTREVIEGPEVRDYAGTKLLYCKARVSLPSGRTETAVATLPLADLAMAIMKVETKAKRRATLAILGLAMLDETEIESIPASAKSLAAPIELGQLAAPDAPPVPTPLDRLRDDLVSVETREQLRTVWHEHRAAIAAMDAPGEDACLRQARELMWECASSQGLARTKKELAEVLRGPSPGGPGGAPRPAEDPPADVRGDAYEGPDDRGAAQARLLAAIGRARQCESSVHLVRHVAAHVEELPAAQRQAYLEACAEYGWRRYPRALKSRATALAAFAAERDGRVAA